MAIKQRHLNLICPQNSEQTIHCYRWKGTIPKYMDAHPILDKFVVGIIISIPEKAQIFSMIMMHKKSIEHLLNIGSYGNKFLSEPE